MAQTTESGTGLQGLMVQMTTALATEKQAYTNKKIVPISGQSYLAGPSGGT
jgi:hypothetical protein